MHELIGAIVYAENEKEALIRARNAFSRLVTFDVMDGQTVCTSRFDYFMMFDTQTEFDFAKSVSNFFKNGFYMTRKSYDKNGDIIWEKKDFDRSFDYSKSLIRHWKFKPVGEESPKFLPPLFPISDPNAEHLLQVLIGSVKRYTMKTLTEFKTILNTKTFDELFQEDIFTNSRLNPDSLLEYYDKFNNGIYHHSNLFDPIGRPIRTQGELDCLLCGDTIAYLYDDDQKRVKTLYGGNISKILIGEAPFNTEEGKLILLNNYPQWLVFADAHF